MCCRFVFSQRSLWATWGSSPWTWWCPRWACSGRATCTRTAWSPWRGPTRTPRRLRTPGKSTPPRKVKRSEVVLLASKENLCRMLLTYSTLLPSKRIHSQTSLFFSVYRDAEKKLAVLQIRSPIIQVSVCQRYSIICSKCCK